MSDAEVTTTQVSDDQQPVFQIQRVYLKEASLEQPNSPAIFLEKESPSIDIQIGIEVSNLADGMFENIVIVTVHAKVNDKTIFLVEGKQAGIFEIRNVPQEQMGPIMGITCPQIVYPYLRSNIADMVQRAGFPPVHLTELNFQAMYEQQQAQLAQQPTTAEGTAQ